MKSDRVGFCPVRQLTYIRPAVPMPDRTEARCPTCGRAENCCCGDDCLCPVTKEAQRHVLTSQRTG